MASSLITPGLAVGGQPAVGEASDWVPALVLPYVHVSYVAEQVVPRLTSGAAWRGGDVKI